MRERVCVKAEVRLKFVYKKKKRNNGTRYLNGTPKNVKNLEKEKRKRL